MKTPVKRVYLSSADLQLESYLDADSFERNLLTNLLFQPGVLVPDIFFFISAGIAQHLSGSNMTLLEAGLRKGEVIASFRDKSIGSFTDALRVAMGNGDERNAILGIRDDAKEIAHRLDAVLDNKSDFTPEYWPEHSIGSRFQMRIETLLANGPAPRLPDNIDIPQTEMEQLWSVTKKWRTDCVQAAVDETRLVAGSGLRRGMLITAVGRSVGVVSGDETLENVAELLDSSLPQKTLRALEYFFRWVTDIYQYNQAREFGAIPSFPECEPVAGVFAGEFLKREARRSGNKPERTTLTLRAPMPNRSSLAHVSADDLLEIKRSVGMAYFIALSNWQNAKESSINLEQNLERSLNDYGNALVKEVRKRGSESAGMIEAVLSRSSCADPILPYTLASTTALGMTQISPKLGILMAVGTNAYAVYRYWRRRPDQADLTVRRWSLRSEKSKNPDVNLS